MENFCKSCGIPLQGDDGKDYRGSFCNYCTDESGKLYSRERIQKGIAAWLARFSEKDDETVLMQRADLYLKAMPAWAE